MENNFKLYSYFRSSASYRVRVALNLKKIPFEYIPVHLLNEGGEQHFEEFKKLNPMEQIPCLVHNGQAISQSMAILQYLDEVEPQPRLFPSDPFKKAKVIEMSEITNSGIHPIQNLSVFQEMVQRFGLDNDGKADWARFWIDRGFKAIERQLEASSGTYCFGDELTAADLFLVPQVYNAHRFQVDMGPFPLIQKVNEACLQLAAFKKAEPSQQPDTPEELKASK